MSTQGLFWYHLRLFQNDDMHDLRGLTRASVTKRRHALFWSSSLTGSDEPILKLTHKRIITILICSVEAYKHYILLNTMRTQWLLEGRQKHL